MKAYVLNAINQLDFTETPIPTINASQVLVEVKAAGICGSDIPRIYETGTYRYPTIPGHEFSGVVKAVGNHDKSSDWIGKRVGVFPLIPCQKCCACKKKLYEMCRNYNYLGSRCDGGFAEYVAVPEWNLIQLPDEVSFEDAAMLEPAAVALHSLRRVQLSQNMTVAVLGLGMIGLLIVQWIAALGIENVYATGHHKEHGELMKSVGKHTYAYYDAHNQNVEKWLLEETGGTGVDLVIDCAGFSQTLTEALNVVSPGGQILVVGNPHSDMILPKESYWKLLRNQITITGSWNSTFNHQKDDDWHKVLEACKEGKIDLNKIISHRLPFSDLEKGLDIMYNKTEYRNKIIIVR
ncbi:galactitol-1-phosphate 5-dehydrogenase [[Clostridium] fimetarium]|uniref:L-iditol 2-dehydrogenase n=1 Tax=[Clostridium] fimetarium TaxID=99656 RepID=A0A1I0P5I8_9FIRM|nr:galactitol-1-phosphate 5-dehydrogenase [[Clostridium] fimetarium]SEW09299.1 L-iditol 2-dehydrogenase [[Clostridium] fimetarium]